MQDRFKFRHFNLLTKKMTYYDKPEMQVCLSDDFKSGLIFPLSEEYDGNAMYMGNYTYYQQCTGLKDKNGKLIFEEDIVKINENYPDYSAIGDFYKNQNFVVEYFQPRACYLLKPFEYEDNSGNGIYDLSPDFYEFLQWKPIGKFEENTLQGIEIIGNIHENPELLEAE